MISKKHKIGVIGEQCYESVQSDTYQNTSQNPMGIQSTSESISPPIKEQNLRKLKQY